jgi:hypothetical protein
MDSLLPFLQGTCTPYNMPVYPGALRFAGDSTIMTVIVRGLLTEMVSP